MVFKGVYRDFSLKNEEQYDTIGRFWDEMSERYGIECLIGLGYEWCGARIRYAIGLRDGVIDDANVTAILPDVGWTTVCGLTDELPKIYAEIYREGALRVELESFTEDGRCEIRYIR